MSTQNPDFSLDSKKRIAKTVRTVEGFAAEAGNVTRPAFPRTGQPLHFGKIQSVAGCSAFAIVKECNKAGDKIFSDDLITVNPTKGGCESTDNGFCYHVGDVIAFIFDPEDETEAYQVGVSKTVSAGLECPDSGDPTGAVSALNRIVFYNTDFHFVAKTGCDSPADLNEAHVGWRGNIVLSYSGGPSGGICGATNTANTGGVKVFNFDKDHPANAVFDAASHARVAFTIGCVTTSANVPTIGGGPCPDPSLPKQVNIIAFLPTTVIEWVSDVVCNGDGTITKTFSSARVCVPFT